MHVCSFVAVSALMLACTPEPVVPLSAPNVEVPTDNDGDETGSPAAIICDNLSFDR